MRMVKISVLATALTVGALAAVGAAGAETTTFAGLACVEEEDTAPEIRYAGGEAQNDNATYDAKFACPIDRPNSNQSGDITSVFVRVYDLHPSEAVECRIHSCNGHGTSCTVSAWKASPSTGTKSLGLGSIQTWGSGYAYLQCSIPNKTSTGRSAVISYRTTD